MDGATTLDATRIGSVYGRLTIVARALPRGRNRSARYDCLCECGRITNVKWNALQTGNTRSCGCARFIEAAALGTTRHTAHGYAVTKVPGRGQGKTWRFEHIVVAEQALGHPLPSGAVVHHVDDDGTRNVGENLCILQSHGEHMRLHARRRILRAGGDPFRDLRPRKRKRAA